MERDGEERGGSGRESPVPTADREIGDFVSCRRNCSKQGRARGQDVLSLLTAIICILLFLLLVCVLELRDTRRRLGELPSRQTESTSALPEVIQTIDAEVGLAAHAKLFLKLLPKTFAKVFLYSTKEELQQTLQYYFGRAKVMSDFVAMIVRLGVAVFILEFIIRRYNLSTSHYEGLMLYLGEGAVIMFTVVFAFYVQLVVLEYLVSELAVHRNIPIRITLLAYNILLLFAIYTVIDDVVAQMAGAGLPR
jgi:hypothetical protein